MQQRRKSLREPGTRQDNQAGDSAMRRWGRLLFFLVLNMLVTACTMVLVLSLWGRFNPVPVAIPEPPSFLNGGGEPTVSVSPTPELTPTLALTIYEVQPGDTLSSIAADLGISPALLMELNGFTDPNALGSGQMILIPDLDFEPAMPFIEATEPAATPTPLPIGDELQLEIVSIVGAGVLQDERVTIRLLSDTELSMANWSLEDNEGNVFTFPLLTLFEGGAVSVYSRGGSNNAIELFWGLPEATWEVGETAVLRDPNGNIRATFQVP